jgi:uncharacterized protein YkwD
MQYEAEHVRHLIQVGILGFILSTLPGCGGEASDAADEDTTVNPPTNDDPATGFSVTSRYPEPGATDRALLTEISITFSDPLLSDTAATESITLSQAGEPVPADISYEAGSTEVAIVPHQRLQPETTYTVTISDELMAADGTTFSGDFWQFATAANVGLTPQSVMDECMSESDIEMLGRINDARVSERYCGEELAPATHTLVWHCTIAAAAQKHSDDMADNNFFSHTGSDGTNVADRLTNAGYSWRTAGENIAAGQTSVEAVMTDLLESPGHCLNIMNNRFEEMGAALAENPDAEYRRYWTQNFARPH